MSKSTLHLDLHEIAHNGKSIDQALDTLMHTAITKKVKRAEVIPGKGSGQLMKRVKKFLAQKEQRAKYDRIVVDANNHGRLFIYFR